VEFLKDYFEQEKNFLMKFYIQKKSKKGKGILKKLGLIEEAVRDRIIKVYMDKCLIEYFVKFNNWRAKAVGDESARVDPEELEKRQNMLKAKVEKLFKGTDVVVEDGTARPPGQQKQKQGEEGEGSKHHKKQHEEEVDEAGPPPIFLMFPGREVMHRMVVRATQVKKLADLDF